MPHDLPNLPGCGREIFLVRHFAAVNKRGSTYKAGGVNEQLLSWQIKGVWPKIRKKRKRVKMKTASWEPCVSWRDGERIQGRLCKEMTLDLGLDVEAVGFLIYRYWGRWRVAEGMSRVWGRED